MSAKPGCPHRDIRCCPLYHAAHEAGWGMGCDDGRLGEGGCATDRKLDYDRAVARLRAHHPGYVEVIELWELRQASKDQMRRNMRFSAVH